MNGSTNHEETLFEQALRLPTSAERESFLMESCANDTAMRDRLLGLLGAHNRAGKFLEHQEPRPSSKESRPQAETEDPNLVTQVQLTEGPGTVIDRYKLLQKLGEGGMGVVYMAEQEEPVRRRVALKIIKLGMDTKSVIARFEAERQALAMMDHPNIAKVLDGGATDAARPYFVMELVRGIKITEYCDEAKLSTRERLDLFIKVCQAIQHAHQKGIIHRDIKPSNILVTINDGVAVPKVIDFGIAKATEGRLTDKTLFTQFEALLGTPAYMSPEQAVMTSLDIDTRSDIYSLGVLLYELLAGSTPFDPKELMASGIDAMRKTIREKEPLKPSTKLSQTLVAADVRRRTSGVTEESAAFGGIINVAAEGHLVCVTAIYGPGASHVRILDISDPAQPRWVAQRYPSGWGLATDGRRCYVVGFRGFEMLDLTTPANPQRLGAGNDPSFYPADVEIVGGLAYVAGGRWSPDDYKPLSPLVILDISDPSRPRAVGSYDTNAQASAVQVSGNEALLATGEGLQIVDVSNPANVKHLGTFKSIGSITGVVWSGNYAFALEEQPNGGFRVIDVNDATKPQQVGSIDIKEGGLNQIVSGEHAYVVTRAEGLLIIDLSDPRVPRRTGAYVSDQGKPLGLAIKGNLLYLSVTSDPWYWVGSRLEILDIADPSRPQRISGTDIFVGQKMALEGTCLYSVGSGGLNVVDVSDPTKPRRVGGNSAVGVPNYSFIKIAGEKAFVGASYAREILSIVDLYDPHHLRLEALPVHQRDAFHLRVTGPNGLSVRIQRSAELPVWMDWDTVTLTHSPFELMGWMVNEKEFFRVICP